MNNLQKTNNITRRPKAFSPCSSPADSFSIPFPGLPKSIRPRKSNLLTNRSSNKRRERVHAMPLSASATTPRSAPISLPESHIRRTTSELQLAADTLHAECKDVAMYSRLMTGIHNQIQHRCSVLGTGEDDMHPLSKKSMLGIVKTKQANDYELEHCDDSDNDEDDGWDKLYGPIDEDSEHFFIASSPEAALPPRHVLKDSLSTLLCDIESGGLEDDCLFSLEL